MRWKEKVIRKWSGKYEKIYPLSGKKRLEECFYDLHGKRFFCFRTKDRKRHVVDVTEMAEGPDGVSYHRPRTQSGPGIIEFVRKMNKPISYEALLELLITPISLEAFREVLDRPDTSESLGSLMTRPVTFASLFAIMSTPVSLRSPGRN